MMLDISRLASILRLGAAGEWQALGASHQFRFKIFSVFALTSGREGQI